MNIYKTIITFIILSIAAGISYYQQDNFEKITYNTTPDYLLDYNLGNFNEVATLVMSIFGENLVYTLQTQSLAIDIEGSVSFGKNNWLKDESNMKYIKDFITYYKDVPSAYSLLSDAIVSENIVINSKNKDIYSDLLDKNLLSLKGESELNIKENNPYYYKIQNKTFKKYCKNFPENKKIFNSDFSSYYTKLSLIDFNNENYIDALCYNALSGYKNKVSGWQTLYFGIVIKIFNQEIEQMQKEEKSIEDIELYTNKILAHSEEIYNDTMSYITNKKKQDFHRNSNDIKEIRDLNKAYAYHINTIKYLLLKIKNNYE